MLGLIIGALAIWLIVAFTGAGPTMLLTANKLGNSTTATTTETITEENVMEAIIATKNMMSLSATDASRQKFESALAEYQADPANATKTEKTLCAMGSCVPDQYNAEGKLVKCKAGFWCQRGKGGCGPVVGGKCGDCIPPK